MLKEETIEEEDGRRPTGIRVTSSCRRLTTIVVANLLWCLTHVYIYIYQLDYPICVVIYVSYYDWTSKYQWNRIELFHLTNHLVEEDR